MQPIHDHTLYNHAPSLTYTPFLCEIFATYPLLILRIYTAFCYILEVHSLAVGSSHSTSLTDADTKQQPAPPSPSQIIEAISDVQRLPEDADSSNFELVLIPWNDDSSYDILNGSNGPPTTTGDVPRSNGMKSNLPFKPCSFAACGEEFSCVISRDRSVYAWGLGIAGMLM